MIKNLLNTILYIKRSQDPNRRYIEHWFHTSPFQQLLLNHFNTITTNLHFYKEDSKLIKLPPPMLHKFAKMVREIEPQSEWIKEYDYLQTKEGIREISKLMDCSKLLKIMLKDSSKRLPNTLYYRNPTWAGIIGESDQREQFLPISKKDVLEKFKHYAEADLQQTALVVQSLYEMKNKIDLQVWLEEFYYTWH